MSEIGCLSLTKRRVSEALVEWRRTLSRFRYNLFFKNVLLFIFIEVVKVWEESVFAIVSTCLRETTAEKTIFKEGKVNRDASGTAGGAVTAIAGFFGGLIWSCGSDNVSSEVYIRSSGNSSVSMLIPSLLSLSKSLSSNDGADRASSRAFGAKTGCFRTLA